MPSTPEVAAARDVSAASDECRLNALKNRKENDWFGHDAGSRTPSVLRPASSSGGARTPNKTSQESEQWFRYDVNGASLPARPEAETAASLARERAFAEQDWYKHGPDVPDPPSMEKKSKTRSRRSACANVRHKASDPNEWFRHDHDHDHSKREATGRKPIKPTSPTALWIVYPEDGQSSAELASASRPKTRLTAPEADDYHRRDKLGSSAEWFSHEHPRGDVSGSSGLVPRARGTTEVDEIANRLKCESEDWFRHDANRNYVIPLPVAKGNSPLAKELVERAQGREIKQVFCMEENLRATWTAPPSFVGEAAQAQSAQAPSAKDPPKTAGGTSDESVQGLLRNGHRIAADEENALNN